MGGVVLDASGKVARRDRARIYVPPGLVEDRGEPIGRCHVCADVLGRETKFFRGEEGAWQRHVGECARAHLSEIRELAAKRNPLPDYGDPEVEQHMLGVGRRMLAEKRWEMRPSERAGLS